MMDNFTAGLLGVGIIILIEIFLVVFGGVEKEDPYSTSHSIKKSHFKKK